MRLSNSLKCFLLTALIVLPFPACRQAVEPLGVPASEPRPSPFPFTTIEPPVYQAVIEISGDGVSDRWFVAKKNELWRIDFYDGGGLTDSIIRSGELYRVDHRSKVYFPLSGGAGDPGLDPSSRFFSRRENLKFSRVGTEGDLTRFRAASDAGTGVVDVLINEANGLMVREEFRPSPDAQPNFVYEMKDLAMSVDDQVFAMPQHYRRLEKPPAEPRRAKE